jgi:PadR family transcriptional regulator, regulatory protein PadR
MLRGEKPGTDADLLQGTLDMLLLKAVARKSRHGYAIAEWIREMSEESLQVEEGALYPALHRLELRGLLSSEWGLSDNNRRAKYYALTAVGRKQLTAEADAWARLSKAIGRVLLASG